MLRTLAICLGLVLGAWGFTALIDSSSKPNEHRRPSNLPDASISEEDLVGTVKTPPKIIWMDLGTPRDVSPRPNSPQSLDEVKRYGLLGARADSLENYLETLSWSREQSGRYRHKTGASMKIESERGQLTRAHLVLPPSMASPDVQVLLDVILGAEHSSPVDLERLMMEGTPLKGRMSTVLGLELIYASGRSADGFQKPFLKFELGKQAGVQP